MLHTYPLKFRNRVFSTSFVNKALIYLTSSTHIYANIKFKHGLRYAI